MALYPRWLLPYTFSRPIASGKIPVGYYVSSNEFGWSERTLRRREYRL